MDLLGGSPPKTMPNSVDDLLSFGGEAPVTSLDLPSSSLAVSGSGELYTPPTFEQKQQMLIDKIMNQNKPQSGPSKIF